MNTELNILFPQRDVALGENLIQVRELAWREALAFLGALGQHAQAFLRPDGGFAVNPDVISTLILSSHDLTITLLRDTTDLSVEQIAGLPASAVMELLDAALELNLNDEVLGRGKKLAAHFARLGAAMPSGLKS